ncbi:MAG: hypothetical protein ACT4P6_18110 [Gemmatimonadaceae bacterium]
MERRDFLKVVGSAAASRALLASALVPRAPSFRAWTWFHGNTTSSEAAWRTRFARLRAAGITGLLVADGDMARIAAAAKAEGLEYHRWIHTMYRSNDRWAKRNHPEWFSVSRNGESSLTRPPYVPSYNWFCPNRDGVREYLRSSVERIAARPDVHGVHLDYIRFIDVILPRGLWSRYNLVQDREMPQFDFCYCDVCREKFKQQSGIDPMKLEDAPAHEAWRAFRWNSITALVTLLSRAVRGRGKEINAAVFATPTLARQLVRQAWDEWPLDAVFPMLYHHFYLEDVEWIGRATREGVQALAPSVPLYAGVFVPRLDPAQLARAVAITRDAGAAGVALFSMPRLTTAHLAALGSALGA